MFDFLLLISQKASTITLRQNDFHLGGDENVKQTHKQSTLLRQQCVSISRKHSALLRGMFIDVRVLEIARLQD